ncbi:MAG: pyrroline-5-carboxylate reductase [Syntrophomonadaceae bacterium]|nr:pyrroline-5-carboxylate reductase [Syntrophomonadaceae bacterium]
MTLNLGVIGCGKMAYAILKGLVNHESIKISQLLVNDIDEEKINLFVQEFKAIRAEQKSLIESCDAVILAVKPYQIESVIKDNLQAFKDEQLIISIAAGVKTNTIEEMLSNKGHVVRVMPNTPALVGQGVTAITSSQSVPDNNISLVQQIFDSIGKTYIVDEKYMDAITAISGSGPAYVYLWVEALINAGVLIGLDNNLSKDLVINTIKGSMAMIEGSGKHPAELRDGVCSPGGTTIAAVRKLEEMGIRSAIFAGVEKAYLRSKELGEK